MKKSRLFSNLISLQEFLHKFDVKLTYFILPVILSFVAAFLEGVSAGLLVPLAKGVIAMDFSFAREAPILKTVLLQFSHFFKITNSFIFILLVIFVFSAVLLKNIFQYATSLAMGYQVRNFSHNMRRKIFNRYLSFGKTFFDRNSEGYLHNLLMDFTNIVSQKLIELNSALNNCFMLIVYVILMLLISYKLTLLLILISPIFYYVVGKIIEKIKFTSRFYASSRGNLSKKISNILSIIPLVKAYTNEKEEEKEFEGISKEVASLEFSMDKKYNLITPLQEIIILILMLLLISAVAFIVVKKKESLAGFLVFFYIMKRATVAFGVLSNFRAQLSVISGPLAEISKVFDNKDKFFVPEGKRQFESLQRSINFSNLPFSYIKDVQVLKDVTFSIEKGKITAIVGPTGAGKSTIINLILRFYDCAPVSIFMDDVDIREFTFDSLRAHMALVSQDILLFNDSIRKNIVYGLDRNISEEALTEIMKKARLFDFVMNLPEGLNTLIGDRGVKLSGGEKQRVAIARALLKGSEILFLDEATSALDTKTELLIQQAIEEAIRGRTVIVVAHRLSTIKNADKIIVIEQGRLVEQGNLNELLDKKGKFYQYWIEQKFY